MSFTYDLYRKTMPRDVFTLGCFVARAHSEWGLPYDVIATRLGWYDRGFTEDNLAELATTHRRATEKGLTWEQAEPMVASLQRYNQILSAEGF